MKKKIIHFAQTCWLAFSGGASWGLSRVISDSYWLSIPLFIVIWIIAGWIGITIVSLFDSDHRLCAKYGIKIENLPLYKETFRKLMEAEARGEDVEGITDTIPDKEEWMRFLQSEYITG